MGNYATISADIIAFTSLYEEDRKRVAQKMQEEISRLTKQFDDSGFYGRIVQGDNIECVSRTPGSALRLALILKTYLKSLDVSGDPKAGFKLFNEYAMRIAIAIAHLNTFDIETGVLDGEAIYLSGRAIKNKSTSGKQKVRIKETIWYKTADKEQQERFSCIFTLIDTLLSKCSARQSEILYYKLNGISEKEIVKITGVSQPTISQHSTAAGWHSIEKAVKYFEKTVE